MSDDLATQLLRSAQFCTSAAKAHGWPPATVPELAFAGRSNAGKSSSINLLCGQKALARTSKTPGRTQLINFFDLGEEARLVDLPGYGFAKAPTAVREQWKRMIDHYLTHRESLVGLVQIMDARRPMTEFDQQMLAWCAARPMPCLILLNKADKLSKNAAASARMQVQKAVGDGARVVAFSARTGAGLAQAREGIWELLFPQVV